MASSVIERRRTGIDIVLGIVLVLAGAAVIANAAAATWLTFIVLGIFSLAVGVLLLVSALLLIKSGEAWPPAIGGGLLVLFGVVLLSNTLVSAVVLTALAGFSYLIAGVVRMGMASVLPGSKWPGLITGGLLIFLGAIILLNPLESALVLFGIVVGLHLLLEGISFVLLGRWRLVEGTA